MEDLEKRMAVGSDSTQSPQPAPGGNGCRQDELQPHRMCLDVVHWDFTSGGGKIIQGFSILV